MGVEVIIFFLHSAKKAVLADFIADEFILNETVSYFECGKMSRKTKVTFFTLVFLLN